MENITVAIADDHELWREKLAEILTDIGFSVTIKASNGRTFLAMLSNCPTLPDLCVLDINMPVMDGFETAGKLKERYPQVKILAFSMDNDEAVIAKIKDSGADDFIAKGCGLNELKNALVALYNAGSGL